MSFTIVEQATAAPEPLRARRPRLEPAALREGREGRRRRGLPRPRGRGGAGREGAGAQEHRPGASTRSTGGRRPSRVRINGLDTPYMYRDVVDVLEQAGDRLDLIMIPKVGTAADVYAVDMLVTQIEQAKGAQEADRLRADHRDRARHGEHRRDRRAPPSATRALHFGVADYAASTRARTVGIGGPNPDYAVLTDKGEDGSATPTGATCGTTPSPAWWWRRAQRACGRSTGRSATSPTPTASAPRRGARPCWAARANGRSTPRRWRSPTRSSRRRAKEVERARRILEAMEQARQEGQGRGLARRPADRHRLDPPGRAARRQGRHARQAGLRSVWLAGPGPVPADMTGPGDERDRACDRSEETRRCKHPSAPAAASSTCRARTRGRSRRVASSRPTR